MKKRILRLSVILMALLLVMGIATACQPPDGPDETPVKAGAEAGTYYYDVSDDLTYYITLADNRALTFELGEKKEGKYDISGTALTFELPDGEKIEAELAKEDELVFAYKNTSYIFLKQTDKIVKFVADGKETEQKVINGRKAVRPTTNPTKSDYLFAGWFADSGFQTKYNFDNRIRENTSIYAKFIEAKPKNPEFKVDFVTGDGATEIPETTTRGGKIDIENLKPEKSGDTFLGWYVSHNNERGKLTYEYDFEELFEDTTFFAVWASDFAVSVKNDKIVWNKDGNAAVEVKKPDGTTENASVNGKQATYTFTDKGEYEIKVTIGSESKTAYYTHNRLARVSATEIDEEEGVLHFYGVPGATEYTVDFTYKRGSETVTENVAAEYDAEAGQGVFDFTGYDIPDTGFVFQVKANANDYVSSKSEAIPFSRTLEQVTNISLANDGYKLQWASVEGATSYALVVKAGDDELVNTTLQTNEYSLIDVNPGALKVSVTPRATGWLSPVANTADITKTKLVAVKRDSIVEDGGHLVWEEVKGAKQYSISINGEPAVIVDGTSYDIPSSYYTGEDITIVIIAIAADVKDNAESVSLTIGTTERVTGLEYEKGIFRWSQISGTRSYLVRVNDGEEFAVEATQTPVTFDREGENKLYVRINKEDSEPSSIPVTAYKVVINAGYETTPLDPLYLAKGDAIDLQSAYEELERYGYDFLGWYKNENKNQLYHNNQITELTEEANLTLTAEWRAFTLSLNFDLGKMANEEATDDAFSGFKATFGTKELTKGDTHPTELPVPTTDYQEYLFEGWYTDTTYNTRVADENGALLGNFSRFNEENKEVKLYAHWVSIFIFSKEANGSVSVSQNGRYLTNFEKVTIPEYYTGELDDGTTIENAKVTHISDFKNLSSLKILEIPASIMGINLGQTGEAFSGCTSLIEIRVTESVDATYMDKDGVLFRKDEDGTPSTLVYYPLGRLVRPYNENDDTYKTYEIPDGVRKVDAGAFYTPTYVSGYSKVLEKIVFPASLESLAVNAIFNIDSLKEIEFAPESASTSPATAIDLANGFGGSQTYYSSAYKVTTITGLPKRMKTFYIDFFDKFNSLETITVEDGHEVFETEPQGGVVRKDEYNTKELIYMPKGNKLTATEGVYTVGNDILSVGAGAFKNNGNIKGLVISANVERISKEAFRGCINLATITINGDTQDADLVIEENAFDGKDTRYTSTYNNSLKTLTLPERVKSIGVGAFANNRALTEVFVNTDRENMEFATGAFTAKDQYATVRTVHIGANVPAFAVTDVFGSALAEVELNSENKAYMQDSYGILYDHDQTKIIFFPEKWENSDTPYSIPEGITRIPTGLFKNRTGLKEVIIHNNVTEIGDEAFSGCADLETVTFTDGGTTLIIGNQAFYNCGNLIEIQLPDYLTEIGSKAFASCKKLVSITIPNSVKKIGSADNVKFDIFDGCTALQTIEFEDGNENYITSEGIVYKTRKVVKDDGYEFVADTLLYCPQGATGVDGTVTIPSSVRRVAQYAFEDVSTIKKIVFDDLVGTGDTIVDSPDGDEPANVPDTVELIIEQYAFYRTYVKDSSNKYIGLEEVEFPEGLKAFTTYIFWDCYALKKINVPASVTTIARNVFMTADALDTIVFDAGGTEDLVIEDGESDAYGAFSSLRALRNITFPARLTQLGISAFYNSNIQNVTFTAADKEERKLTIKDGAFQNSSLQEIHLASGLTSIGKYAFSYSKITNIELPDTIIEIGDNAFQYSSLQSITFPASLEKIGASAFMQATSLAEVNFASEGNLTTIGKSAFAYTKGLGSITIPKSVTTIDPNAFESSGITTLTFEEGSKLATIGDSAFKSGSLQEIRFDYTSTTPLTIGNYAFQTCSVSSIVLPKNVTSIGNYAFASMRSLETFTFDSPDDGTNLLATIGTNVFESTNLTSISFPVTQGETLTIGSSIFNGCKKLTTIHLSKSVTKITDLIRGCGTVTEITVDEDSTHFRSKKGEPILYTLDGDGNESIYMIYADVKGDFVIGRGATEIANSAFANAGNIENIIIPSTVTKIGDYAFMNCVNLKSVTFGRESQLTSVGKSAFKNCINLQSIDFRNVNSENLTFVTGTTIEGTFYNCQSLTTVRFGHSLTNMGTYMFNHSGIQTVDLSGCVNLEAIGNYSFYDTPSLNQVIFPENGGNLNFFGTYTFNKSGIRSIDLSSLKIEHFGSSKTDVKASASNIFMDCANLTQVTLPEGTLSLGGNMFKNCTSLTQIDNLDNVVTFGSNVFENSGIQSFTLRGGVTYNGNMFLNCKALSQVNIDPDTAEQITELKASLFEGCSALTSFDFAALPKLNKLNSKTFRGTGLSSVDLSATAITKLSYTSVFADMPNLTDISLPTGITALEDNAFNNCDALITLDLSKYTSLKIIGKTSTSASNTFQGCDNLTTVILPDACTTLGSYAFRDCVNLSEIKNATGKPFGNVTIFYNYCLSNTGFTDVTIPETSTSNIKPYVFEGCKKLTTITFPTGLTTLNDGLCDGCTNLSEITWSNVTTVGKNSFRNCISLNGTDFEGCKIVSIGESSFQNCIGITSFDFSSVTSLGKAAFMGSGLTTVDLSGSNLKTISNQDVFKDCVNLTTVKLPDVMTFLGKCTFQGCTALEEIDLSNTQIEQMRNGSNSDQVNVQNQTFYGCTSLRRVITRPGQIKAVGTYTFKNCTSLEQFDTSGLVAIGTQAFFNCGLESLDLSSLPDIHTTSTKDPVTGLNAGIISQGIFAGMINLREIKLADDSAYQIKEIDEFNRQLVGGNGIVYAEYMALDNSALTGDVLDLSEYDIESIPDGFFANTNFTSVKFPASLKKIGAWAFAGSKLQSVTIPSTVTEIAQGAFANCPDLTTVVFEGGEDTILLGDGNSNTASSDDKAEDLASVLTNFGVFEKSGITNVTLSERVTTIPIRAFRNNRNLQNIVIPNGVTTIGQRAFEETRLVNIDIPETVTTLKSYAFQNIPTLETAILRGPSVTDPTVNPLSTTNTNSYLFVNDSALRTVELLGDMSMIEGSMFQNCTSLTSIKIPNSVVRIESSAFVGSGITKIEFGEGSQLKKLDNKVFENTPLEYINLPEGFETFGSSAFANCTQMKYIVIPSTVISMPTGATNSPFSGWGEDQHIFLKVDKFVSLSLYGLDWCQNIINNVHYSYQPGDEKDYLPPETQSQPQAETAMPAKDERDI